MGVDRARGVRRAFRASLRSNRSRNRARTSPSCRRSTSSRRRPFLRCTIPPWRHASRGTGAALRAPPRAYRREPRPSAEPHDRSASCRPTLRRQLPNRRTPRASTRSVYAAARKSSATTPTPFFIAASSCRIGGGFSDVEQAEQQERESLAQRIRAREIEDEEERRRLVDDDATMIRRAEIATGALRSPHAGERQRGRREQPYDIARVRVQQPSDRQRDQRAESSRRDGRETGAEPQRDEMRGMAEQERDRRRARSALARWLNGSGRMHAAMSSAAGPARRGRAAPYRR